MSQEKKYDVFISYRREGGKNIARLLKTELGLRGYHAFLDFDELKDGRFDKRIMDAIDAAPVFMFILSEHALDRCVDENDWVRKEIEYAMATERHIIPINPDKSFGAFPDYVPKNLSDGLGLHQFSQLLLDDMFNQSMDKLVDDRLVPVLGKRNRYQMSTSGATIHMSTDINCEVYRYGKHECNVVTGEDKIVYLKKGKHKFEFVSIDDERDRYTIIFEVEDIDVEDLLEIALLPIVHKREQEEHAAAERSRREAEEIRRLEEEERKKREGMFTVNGVSFKMVAVQGGTFTMGATAEQGSEDPYDDEKPAHQVTLSDYRIGETEVTQELWQAVMGISIQQQAQKGTFSHDLYGVGNDNPMYYISWDDCQEFVKKLNQLTGKQFRLPTEAEWEYAARGGNKSRGYKYAGSNTLGDVAWYDDNSGNQTHPVKQKQPNELGLYDMSGNVYEWCQDWFGDYSSNAQINPKGVASGSFRVGRGGSWGSNAWDCRVSLRGNRAPTYRYDSIGLRLAL